MKKNKEVNLNKWFEGILKLDRMSSLQPFYNSVCLKCGVVEEVMIKVGILVFCKKCCKEEFKTNDPVEKEKSLYKKWLKKYEEKMKE